ncbi:LOW QUALITY PROTEIN: hypothetical protein MAR_025534, partial [Mya arenaria]
MPEFVFGQLDHLTSYRPNASILANEANIMYSFNKTSKWLEEPPEDERNQYIEESRKDGRKIRQTFKERTRVIQEKRLEQLRQKQVDLERREAERIRKSEKLRNEECYYGFWQSKLQVEKGLNYMDSNKEVMSALKCQFQFRKNVLKQQYHDKTVYNLSKKDANGKYIKLNAEVLKQKLLLLVENVPDVETKEVKKGKIPLFHIDHKFDDGKTHRGEVINVVPGFGEWYNIKYRGDPAVYVFNLKADYKKGAVQI